MPDLKTYKLNRKKGFIDMLLRHLQTVVRGFVIVDHVLRRRDVSKTFPHSEVSHSKVGAPEATDTDKLTPSVYVPIRNVAAIMFVLGPIYGAAMGTYAFVAGHRSLAEQVPQLIYSAIKVPLLIALTVAISLPSFFVVNTLLGLRDDFRESLRAIVSAQAGLTIILVSFFPLTLFSYLSLAASDVSYSLAVLTNAAMFGVASVSAQVLLRGYYAKLIKKNPRHRWMVRMWIFVYSFVGIQAGYVLRPFIGDPNTETTFLRAESFQNAYVKLFEITMSVFRELG